MGVFDFELVQVNRKTPLSVNVIAGDDQLIDRKQKAKEVANMLSAMRLGVVGKYYVLQGAKKYEYGKLGKNLGHKIIKDYRFGNLRGIGLEVVNRNRKPVSVKPKIFTKGVFGKVVSGFPEELVIPAKNKGIIYLVIDRGEK